jgi:hypothetical protein
MLQYSRILSKVGSRQRVASLTGISLTRIQQLEAAPAHTRPTTSEEAALRKIFGSADYLFEANTEDNRFKARTRF